MDTDCDKLATVVGRVLSCDDRHAVAKKAEKRLSTEFGTKFQIEIPLLLENPKSQYNVGQAEVIASVLYPSRRFDRTPDF